MRLQSAIHAYKKHGKFSATELKHLFITALIFGFIFSFRRWGDTSGNFNAIIGIQNIILFTLITMLTLAFMISVQKFMSIKIGFQTTYRMWGMGLVISLFFTFLTNGLPILLTPGGIDVKYKEAWQLGYFYKGPVLRKIGIVAFWGLVANVLLAALITILPIETMLQRNLLLAIFLIGVFSLFPLDSLFAIWLPHLPHSNGTIFIQTATWIGIFATTFFIAGWLSVYFLGLWSLLVAIIVSTFFLFLWKMFLAKNKYWVSDKK